MLVEAVIAPKSSLAKKSIKDLHFRKEFNAAILAVHRTGVRLIENLGDIVLEPGDTLVLITSKDFVTLYKNDRRFSIVVPINVKQSYVVWKAVFTGLMALGASPLNLLSVLFRLCFIFTFIPGTSYHYFNFYIYSSNRHCAGRHLFWQGFKPDCACGHLSADPR